MDAAGHGRAILTAGHAASVPGVIVRDEAGDLVGSVLSCRDLDDVAPGNSTADVAVVQIDDRRVEADSEVGNHIDTAQSLDEVRLARSDSTTLILGLSPAFALNQGRGVGVTWRSQQRRFPVPEIRVLRFTARTARWSARSLPDMDPRIASFRMPSTSCVKRAWSFAKELR
jgi:hypothetical protein